MHDILSETIKYLKSHMVHAFQSRGIELKIQDVRYVITIPAIWSDAAKQTMRNCAIQVLDVLD